MILAYVIAALLGPSSTELTIYNQGFGFVKEVRSIDLKPGRQMVAIEDVAAQIDPTSVGFRSLTDKGSFEVLEQNYQYDLISPQAILNKSVGQRLRFIRTIGNTKDVLEGVLLTAPTSVVASPEGGSQQTYNGMVIRTDDGRIVLDPTGEVEVREVPAGLISRPTLLWDLDAHKSGPNSVELSYITQGMSWEANYVLTLGDGSLADLQGWVTLDNQCGTSYENAKLKLLAGEVHQADAGRQASFAMDMLKKADTPTNAPQFQEQSLFEYHLYTLQRPATVKNKDTKQISLLEAKDVPFTKKLVFDWMPNYRMEGDLGGASELYSAIGQFDFGGANEYETSPMHPKVEIQFKNDLKSKLGMPLPKGRFRIYQRDNQGSVQLLGEDRIDHTPKNETVTLTVGTAFDVVGNRKASNVRVVREGVTDNWYEIELRNHKSVDQKVYVIEHPGGDWQILKQNLPSTKIASNTLQFVVTLPANGVRTISYSVQVKE